MKQKIMKIIPLLGCIMALTIFASCGGFEGLKMVEVTGKTIVPEHVKEDLLAAELISVVPGEYELTWEKSSDYAAGYILRTVVGLRLDKLLEWDKYQYKDRDLSSFQLELQDADGLSIKAPNMPYAIWMLPGKSNEDMDESLAKIKKLLSAEVGTVVDVPYFCYLPVSNQDNAQEIVDKLSRLQLITSMTITKKKSNSK